MRGLAKAAGAADVVNRPRHGDSAHGAIRDDDDDDDPPSSITVVADAAAAARGVATTPARRWCHRLL
jgi:hypothetical protein